MSTQLWAAFVGASAVVLIIPGPTILTVISYSIAHGPRANVPLVLAVALGDSTALVVSILGLGALLSTSALWFTVVKVAGGVYLLYLGIKLLCTRASSLHSARSSPSGSRWRLFANTYVVTALNPKSIVFFVAFLPQFIDRSVSSTSQLVLLATTFVSMATLNATLYAIFAASARRVLISPRAQRCFNITGGSLISAAGIWGLLAKRPA
jgi:threonine/homoserine/homoserine lactone efflux protein